MQFAAPTATSDGTQQNINANARFNGFKIETVVVVPVSGLTLSGSFGYVDAKYKSSPVALAGGRVTAGCTPIANGSGAVFEQNCVAIADVPQIPKTSLDLSAAYTIKGQSYGEWSFSVDYARRSRIIWTAVDPAGTGIKNALVSRAYGLLGARIAMSNIPIESGDVRAQISVLGANLTNEKYFFGGTDFGQFGTVTYGLRRSVAVEARIDF